MLRLNSKIVFLWLDKSFILAINNYPCLYARQFICSNTEGHDGCFQVLTVINNSAIVISIQVFCGHKFLTHMGK